MTRAIVFGATGMIGREIAATLVEQGVAVTGIGRSAKEGQSGDIRFLSFDPLDPAADWNKLKPAAPFDQAVWAQGANRNDSAYDFDRAAFTSMIEANVTYVVESLSKLLHHGLLAKPARLCVISSIWQTIARQNKLSYIVSKAAVQGLVQSLAADLGRDGHLINAVLPGVLDTAMTRAMLDPAQLAGIQNATPFSRLPRVRDVAELVAFLCSERNGSTTGQFIAVDLGFRNVRLV